ncbi:MAG: hypothetical protein JOZ31_20130 [Verrucomicrobia bacterium]|nr:hypothetical protein [Verrucomicrobiota bacterium]
MASSASEPPRYPFRRFCWMIANAARWKCPTCGRRPIFVPWYKVRSLQDWFMPLDGCPDCGYPYEREPGYFLLSIFDQLRRRRIDRSNSLFDFRFLGQVSYLADLGFGNYTYTDF